MNERIKELTEQCRIEKFNQYGDLIEFGFDEGKFAELLIRECAEVASSYDGAHYVGNAIKEHFGVE